jgi:hypothetical protein
VCRSVANVAACLRSGDAVRRHGVDPQVNVPAVKRPADTAVAEHDQRSLTGIVDPVEDPASTIDELGRANRFTLRRWATKRPFATGTWT